MPITLINRMISSRFCRSILKMTGFNTILVIF